ncbi:MAG: tRNA dihydrouridine synthase, partial [Candidatus Binatia bacterium]
DVVFTEFVNIQSAFYSPHTLLKDLTYAELERPVVAQIYGRAPELFYKVAHIVCELGFDGLDINMGCPSRKVAASGCGAALIRAPALAREIIREARRGIEDWFAGQSLKAVGIEEAVIESVEACNGQRNGIVRRRLIPVSVKTRLGYERNIVEDWIPVLLEERPSVISLHGRTLQQGYKGNADWDAIARAVEIAHGSETLILGNGDAQDLADVCKRVREADVDGVLLGRAAQGNPWVFANTQEIKTVAAGNEPICASVAAVTLAERFRVINEHCEHYEKLAGNRNFVAMRKHLTWYCKNFRGAAELRSQMIRVNSAREVADCLARFCLRAAEESPALVMASRDQGEAFTHL